MYPWIGFVKNRKPMKDRILGYKMSINKVKEGIKEDLKEYFENIDLDKVLPDDVQIVKIYDEDDLNQLYYDEGFYLILIEKDIDGIDFCDFNYADHKVIYRGHSRSSKKRIMSHLANDLYNQQRKSYEVKYNVCLKMDESVINGININRHPYKAMGWMVIVFKMKDSDKLIREQAESAFDEVYGKPCRSLDN